MDDLGGLLGLLLLLRPLLGRGLLGDGLEGQQIGEGGVLLLLGLLGDVLPEFALFGNPLCTCFCALMGQTRRFGLVPGFLGGTAQAVALGAQTLQLVHDAVRGGLRRRGGNERTGLERRVCSETAVKPDRKLARDLECVQRGAMVAMALVRGPVSNDAHLVEQVQNLGGRGALEFQAAQKVRLRLVGSAEETIARGGLPGQFLAELAELDKAGVGVVRKVPLGQSAQAVKLSFVGPEKEEIP